MLRLLAADPGLKRTYFAGRATAALGMALAIMSPIARHFDQAVTIALLAAVMAMVPSLSVRGPDRRSQLVTTGLVWVLALLATTLGLYLAPYVLLNHVLFVVIMAAAAWAMREGPRGMAVGMVAYMAYFFALFIRARPEQLPWIAAAVTVGVTCMAIVRFLLVPDRPQLERRLLVMGMRARVEGLIRVADRLAAETSPTRRTLRRLEGAVLGVDDVALQLYELADASLGTAGHSAAFDRHLFSVVTLSHDLVAAAVSPLAPERVHVRDEARAARALWQQVDSLERAEAEASPWKHEERPESSEAGAPAPRPEGSEGDADEPAEDGLLEQLRAPVQVALATGSAILVGSLLSSQRWYWAAFSAFVVFLNTDSRGATLRKAIERAVGTAVGIGAGLLAGYLLAGHATAELALIFPVLFIGFWMLQASYATMIAMITILLALLYDLLGILTVDLLVLRLTETVVGAVMGIAVAYFVFPTRTRDVVQESFEGFLTALDDMLSSLETHPGGLGGIQQARLLGFARELDRALGRFRQTARSASNSLVARGTRGLREEIVLSLAARYWTRRLAEELIEGGTLREESGLRSVRDRLRLIRKGLLDTRPVLNGESGASPPLQRLDQILADLARESCPRRMAIG